MGSPEEQVSAQEPAVAESDVAHYARNDELALARRESRPVRALCGTLFTPRRDASKLPVCVVCADLAANWR